MAARLSAAGRARLRARACAGGRRLVGACAPGGGSVASFPAGTLGPATTAGAGRRPDADRARPGARRAEPGPPGLRGPVPATRGHDLHDDAAGALPGHPARRPRARASSSCTSSPMRRPRPRRLRTRRPIWRPVRLGSSRRSGRDTSSGLWVRPWSCTRGCPRAPTIAQPDIQAALETLGVGVAVPS